MLEIGNQHGETSPTTLETPDLTPFNIIATTLHPGARLVPPLDHLLLQILAPHPLSIADANLIAMTDHIAHYTVLTPTVSQLAPSHCLMSITRRLCEASLRTVMTIVIFLNGRFRDLRV